MKKSSQQLSPRDTKFRKVVEMSNRAMRTYAARRAERHLPRDKKLEAQLQAAFKEITFPKRVGRGRRLKKLASPSTVIPNWPPLSAAQPFPARLPSIELRTPPYGKGRWMWQLGNGEFYEHDPDSGRIRMDGSSGFFGFVGGPTDASCGIGVVIDTPADALVEASTFEYFRRRCRR